MEFSAIRQLQPHTTLSHQTLYFINSKLSSRAELDEAPNLLSELQIQCDALDRTLSDLNQDLQSQISRHSSQSDFVGSLFVNIRSQLRDLHLSSTISLPESGSRTGMGKELQALAKEVSRVEAVRNYAETTLKLDTLVGDIEDAVSTSVNMTLRRHPSAKNSQDMRAVALRPLKLAEDVLSSVTKQHSQWIKLVSAVDHRIDRALATLRPQAIADHRVLLASLGWPPPLLTSNTPDDQNPLLIMHRDLKFQYSESFLALCGLQELQIQIKSRQLEGHYKDVSLHQPLWVIEELVNPISIASQRHFSKWIENPEYIFGLVYKITREYVDSMDELLQPLVDEAMLSGYSCREEWISAMVSSLSTYLVREIFPTYMDQLDKESDKDIQTQARISWLHLVDLMIAFDKRVQYLAVHSGMFLSSEEDENTQMSSMTVFCDRPDCLDKWAEIELTEALHKLKSHIENEKNWVNESQEENKAPLISIAVLRVLSSVVDRCRSLPNITLRDRFVKLAGVPIIHKFLDCLLQRCQEAEGLTALTEDNALIKVTKSINAASYFDSVLNELSEDVFFLEMGTNQSSQVPSDSTENCLFYEEIKRLNVFKAEWIEKLSTVILRGFDSHCRDYIKNKKQWLDKSEEESTLSRSFIVAVDYLQCKMSVLKEGLNKLDFSKVWRSLAAGIDKFLFSSILVGNIKFSERGVEKLLNDIQVLFSLFGGWCLRPEGFFPKINEGLKLLKMANKHLKNTLIVEEIWLLRENGIRYLSATEVEKIVKNRVFTH